LKNIGSLRWPFFVSVAQEHSPSALRIELKMKPQQMTGLSMDIAFAGNIPDNTPLSKFNKS
jgi:hypothetical protein